MYQLSRFEFDDFAPESVVHFVLCCCGKTDPYAHRPSEVQKPRHSGFYSTCRDFAVAMASIIHPFLALLASVTRQQLLQQITYLLAENRMLRSKLPDRIRLSNQERRKLIRHGSKLGARIKGLISIVSYSTESGDSYSTESGDSKNAPTKYRFGQRIVFAQGAIQFRLTHHFGLGWQLQLRSTILIEPQLILEKRVDEFGTSGKRIRADIGER